MVRRCGAALAFLLLSAGAFAEAPPIRISTLPTSLAGPWLFRIGHDPAWSSPFRERRAWQTIEVPGCWQRQGFGDYRGHAWYVARIFVSSQMADEDLAVDLGVIADADEVFLNGRPVGRTGDFPPRFEKAVLAHRLYRLPRISLRYGEYNELAVHVFNTDRCGGMLGPAPYVGSYPAMLEKEVLQDVVIYAVAALLLTLGVIQLSLFAVQRADTVHLVFAAFLVLIGMHFVTLAHWGPTLLVGHNTNFRLYVATLLGAVVALVTVMYQVVASPVPVPLVVMQALLALGLAFSLAWRSVSDLSVWIYVAEGCMVVLVPVLLAGLVPLRRPRRPFACALTATAALLALAVVADMLIDLSILPRMGGALGRSFSLFGVVPFALVTSFSLFHRWAHRRWGETADTPAELTVGGRFFERVDMEIERARRTESPFSLVLLRIGGVDAGEIEQLAFRAALMLRRALRQIDTLVRLRVDTFAALLADTEERSAVLTVERLRRAVADTTPRGRRSATVTAGVAQFRRARHAGAHEIVAEVEAALYAATAEGGNCTATAP
jgi:GGDEF domain-containing protein